MNIQDLRTRLNATVNQARSMLDEKGDRKWTEDEKKAYDALMDSCEELRCTIDAQQRLLDMEAEASFADATKVEKDDPAASAMRGYDIFLRHGFNRLTPEQIASVQNAMSVGTDSQGGFTVTEHVAGSVLEQISHYGAMRRVADHITTTDGNKMNFPTSDAREEGEIVKENAAAAAQDIAFCTRALDVHKFSSKIVTVPFELLQDTQVDLVGLINRRLATRIARAQDHFFTTGTGSEQPMGVLTAATAGVTTQAGKTTEIGYDDLVALIESLDETYLEGSNRPKFMISQAARLALRKLKDTAGRPIWLPAGDTGIANDHAGTLLGYDVVVNNFLPAPAASKSPVLFGVFNPAYVIRDVMNVQLFRFDDSAFISKGQVGFMAWARAGGNLIDVNAVKSLKMAAS